MKKIKYLFFFFIVLISSNMLASAAIEVDNDNTFVDVVDSHGQIINQVDLTYPPLTIVDRGSEKVLYTISDSHLRCACILRSGIGAGVKDAAWFLNVYKGEKTTEIPYEKACAFLSNEIGDPNTHALLTISHSGEIVLESTGSIEKNYHRYGYMMLLKDYTTTPKAVFDLNYR